MYWRAVQLSRAAVLLSGCAVERTGADFATFAQRLGPPKAGQARIVVMREKGYGGITDHAWDVKLDEAQLRELKAGTYIYADSPAAAHRLSASETLFPGETNREVRTSSGRTYFFLARLSERAGAQAVGGLAGLMVGAAVTSNSENPGFLDFIPIEEANARAMIAELRLAE
jgi:Protein of unknown function (DUF2846)